jgi:hypothetical protein
MPCGRLQRPRRALNHNLPLGQLHRMNHGPDRVPISLLVRPSPLLGLYCTARIRIRDGRATASDVAEHRGVIPFDSLQLLHQRSLADVCDVFDLRT